MIKKTQKIEDVLPEGCVYYAPDKLKDEMKTATDDQWGGTCLYVGEEGTSMSEEDSDDRICIESYGKDVVKATEDLVKRGVRLLRMYNGLNQSRYLDAKGEGVLKQPLETIDRYFVKEECLQR